MLYLLFFLSGATGLVYEQVWTRQLIWIFGGTTYAVTTVLVAFMGGLGLGSYVAGRRSRTLRRPGQLYGVLEILIGLYALAVPLLLGLADPLYRVLYPHVEQTPWMLTAVRFLVGCGLFVIPTTMMGATLPLLVKFATERGGGFGENVARLYGTNSIGAVVGTLATGFFLIPQLGLSTATYMAGALNVIVGVLAILVLRGSDAQRGTASAPTVVDDSSMVRITPLQRRAALVAFAVSGFAAMVYQIAWTRVLVMSIGSSTYSFGCILAAFILGLAAGSFAVARYIDRWRNPVFIFGLAEILIGASAVLIAPIYGVLPFAMQPIIGFVGGSFELLIWIEFLLVILVTFVPTFLMGAAFPLITKLCVVGTADAGAATGRAYAVNTIGTISGAFLAGFVLIRSDLLGVQGSIVFASLLNAAVGAVLVLLARADGWNFAGRALTAVAGVAVTAVVGLLGARWDPGILSSGAYLPNRTAADLSTTELETVFYREGVDLTVAVRQLRRSPEVRVLSVNGKPDASSTLSDMPTQLLSGHLPVLLARRADDVCVIGLGSGITVAAVARHAEVRSIDCVEISEEVIAAAEDQFAEFMDDVTRSDPRVRMFIADGRNHLRLTTRTYDVITSEPSNPWIAGVASLFTREFFTYARARLNEGGLLCVWLQGYMTSRENFRMVTRTLLEVFDHVALFELREGDFCFIASQQPIAALPEQLIARFEQPSVRADMYRAGLGRLHQILGRFVVADEPLRAWSRGAALHTDDNSILEFSAPRYIYRGEAQRITEELAAIAHSPIGGVISADRMPPDWRRLIEDVQRARALRIESSSPGMNATPRQRVALLVQAAQLDPGNFEIREKLSLARSGSPTGGLDSASDDLLRPLTQIRSPVIAGPRVDTLSSIARQLAIRARAAGRAQLWPLALDYATEALEVDPRSPDALPIAAASLLRAGRSTDAVVLLSRAIDAGALTPEQLQKDDLFNVLREDPAIARLAEPASAAQP